MLIHYIVVTVNFSYQKYLNWDHLAVWWVGDLDGDCLLAQLKVYDKVQNSTVYCMQICTKQNSYFW